MFDFHKDKARYFDMQYRNSKEYIIPFVEPYLDLSKNLNILEIGCAEAGVLKAFLETGQHCTGIELNAGRVLDAKTFLKREIESGKAEIINKNVFEIDTEDFELKFDLVILKDVIEHFPNQEKFIQELSRFLNPDGHIFFGFPPWQMPFGGHQQICKNRFASLFPYYHLFPKFLYRIALKIFGEREDTINELFEIKDCGISIERFEKIVKSKDFHVVNKTHFLINPIYKYKFNLKIRKQIKLISAIPYLRNFFTTAVYYLIKKN